MEINQEVADAVIIDISQKPLSSPAECLARLLQTEEYADLTIVLPGTEKTFKVHRMVLAMWSPVFKAMIFGPMSEGDSIKLPEDHPEAFKWMLNYMYSGCSKLPNVDLAVHVYLLSNKYQMYHLKSTCSKYLMDSVTAVYVPQVMNVATLLEDEGLIGKCTEIWQSSPDIVFSSPSVGSLSPKSLQQLLNLDLHISETVIFQGLLTWGRSQLKVREEDVTSKTIRQEIDNFLPQVRFLTMTTDEFVKNVLPEYILTIEELTKIQHIHASVQGVDIPKACSHIKVPRRCVQSQLQSAKLTYAKQIKPAGNRVCREGEEREYLSAIKCKKEIFLSKLVYNYNTGDNGQLLVRDSSLRDIASLEFDGKEAAFQNPLRLLPGQEYAFVLKGIAKTVGMHTYGIEDNDILSGNISRDVQPFTIHYWK